MYWASIAYIPKGILTKIRNMCFSFLWTGSKQIEGIPLVKWKTLARPKELGGWGIKNLELFCKALTTKTMWIFLQNHRTIWGRVILSKYCPGTGLTDWIRNPDKKFKNGSIGWKEMILAYPLVGHWISWKICDGRKVRVGENPWARAGENYRLSPQLIQHLRSL